MRATSFKRCSSQQNPRWSLFTINRSTDFNAGIGKTEMLGRYNYLALVGGGKNPKFPQNKVVIWDDAKQKPAISLEFKTPVLRVRLSKARIIVVLQNSVHVYAFSTPPNRLSVYETSDNPLGLCCLGAKLVAFPGRSHGQIQVVEHDTGNISIIPAHSSPLRALELSRDGALLATASDTGTLVRVFSTSNCTRVAELRRGVDPAFVFSIAFSPSNKMLAVTSDKSTLHIFDLPSQSPQQAFSPTRRTASPSPAAEEAAVNKWGFLGKVPLLPRVFSDVYSFAHAHFEIGEEPSNGKQSYIPALGTSVGRPAKGMLGWTDESTILVVGAGQDGRWERFKIREDHEGKRFCLRDGWKRYLGAG
ncbi:MAG: hypothetical protein Q9227_003025 [Pyrenula ochraceoflavens]